MMRTLEGLKSQFELEKKKWQTRVTTMEHEISGIKIRVKGLVQEVKVYAEKEVQRKQEIQKMLEQIKGLDNLIHEFEENTEIFEAEIPEAIYDLQREEWFDQAHKKITKKTLREVGGGLAEVDEKMNKYLEEELLNVSLQEA